MCQFFKICSKFEPRLAQISENFGKIKWFCSKFGPNLDWLVYEWVTFSWKIGIYMYGSTFKFHGGTSLPKLAWESPPVLLHSVSFDFNIFMQTRLVLLTSSIRDASLWSNFPKYSKISCKNIHSFTFVQGKMSWNQEISCKIFWNQEISWKLASLLYAYVKKNLCKSRWLINWEYRCCLWRSVKWIMTSFVSVSVKI